MNKERFVEIAEFIFGFIAIIAILISLYMVAIRINDVDKSGEDSMKFTIKKTKTIEEEIDIELPRYYRIDFGNDNDEIFIYGMVDDEDKFSFEIETHLSLVSKEKSFVLNYDIGRSHNWHLEENKIDKSKYDEVIDEFIYQLFSLKMKLGGKK